MKNDNEYKLGDKFFIKKIKKCIGVERKDGQYTLLCNIHQRGNHEYTYNPGDRYIDKGEHKLYWLEDDAYNTVLEAIDTFEQKISEMNRPDKLIEIIPGKLFLSYQPLDGIFNDFFYHLIDVDNKETYAILYDRIFNDMVSDLRFGWRLEDLTEDIKVSDRNYWEERRNLIINPICEYARKTGDRRTELVIKVKWGSLNVMESEELGKILGCRILPNLSEEYDKEYVVDSGTVSYKLLVESGYSILHVPYFSMKGKSHDKWLLNPHRKSGLDAVKGDVPEITFDEYLKMFD